MKKASAYLVAQRWFLHVSRIIVLFLSTSNFFRTSWTIQNLLKSGAEYSEQWHVFSEVAWNFYEGDRTRLTFGNGKFDFDDMSNRMTHVLRTQATSIKEFRNSDDVVFMHLQSLEHTDGNDRCKKFRGNDYLVTNETFAKTTFAYLKEETMMISTGEKTFEGADARTKSENPLDLIGEGYWVTRKSLDIRTFGGLDAYLSALPYGNLTGMEMTLPGHRFNVKSTCEGCRDINVMFEFYCDLVVDFIQTDDPTKMIMSVKKATKSSHPGKNNLHMGLSVVWGFEMLIGDVFRGVAQLIVLCYAIFVAKYGLVSNRELEKTVYRKQREKKLEERKKKLTEQGLPEEIALMEQNMERNNQFFHKFYLFPKRFGYVMDGVPIYFFQHNSTLIIFLNLVALSADCIVTIAYIRETANYALYTYDFAPIYWMCVFGLRFMWVYLALYKVVKYWAIRNSIPHVPLAFTCVWYLYLPATLFAMFYSEDVTLSIYGKEVEFSGLTGTADQLVVSFTGSFFFIRILPYLGSMLLIGLPMCVINYVVNRFWKTTMNSFDNMILLKTSIVDANIGLPKVYDEKTRSYVYISDVGTFLHASFIIIQSVVPVLARDEQQKIAPSSVGILDDEYSNQVEKRIQNDGTNNTKTDLDDEDVVFQLGVWNRKYALISKQADLPIVWDTKTLNQALKRPGKYVYAD